MGEARDRKRKRGGGEKGIYFAPEIVHSENSNGKMLENILYQ